MARDSVVDCVVIGGGPAGSTFAAIVKTHAPDATVIVLERAHHPRYHVGESTIPVINGVLRELGLFETVFERFIHKFGVTFVWGRDRTPWNADYLEINTLSGDGIIDVVGQDFSTLLRRSMRRDVPLTAVNVHRAEFDELLFRRAETLGAEVREGTTVDGILRDGSGRVTGVQWSDDQGQTGTIRADFVLDASGLSSLLTREQRIYDPDLANFAVNGYLRGADWKIVFNGRNDGTTVFIAAVEQGWIWYIPIGDDCMSVGAVTNTAHFKDRLRDVDLETFFWEMLHNCPEIAPLITDAELRDDILPNGRRVAAHQDWASWAKSPVGPGWAAAGDAAIFVDPILSSGVTLAMQSGHRAAYTWLTSKHRPLLDQDALWRAYADYIRGEAGSYLTLARYFYGNNRAAESWWWRAQRLVNASGCLDIDDQAAFTMATAGFFPTPSAINVEIMAPLLGGLLGTDADFYNIYHEDGVPQQLTGELIVQTPFRLALRTQPDTDRPDGTLDVFHDLVADDFAFAHRIAAAPCRMSPALAPIVAAIPHHSTVASLLKAAPDLLPPGFAPPDAIRQSTLAIVANAIKKGYLTVKAPT